MLIITIIQILIIMLFNLQNLEGVTHTCSYKSMSFRSGNLREAVAFSTVSQWPLLISAQNPSTLSTVFRDTPVSSWKAQFIFFLSESQCTQITEQIFKYFYHHRHIPHTTVKKKFNANSPFKSLQKDTAVYLATQQNKQLCLTPQGDTVGSIANQWHLIKGYHLIANSMY